MRKLLQNKIAESGVTLAVVATYSSIIWLLAGAVNNGWWVQMSCLGFSTYLLVELNNSNALLRVRSRMISSVFLALTCITGFLFSSLNGAIISFLLIATLLPLFNSYQVSNSQGRYYYAFLCLGIISLLYVHILYFIPFLWLSCIFYLQSLNMRSWIASCLGLFTPYWFFLPWMLYADKWSLASSHFSALLQFEFPIRYSLFSIEVFGTILFIITLMIISQLNFWFNSYKDRIRIRQLYRFFATIGWISVFFIFLQPQHYEYLLHILIICASPFIAHFFTLTSSKLTNILFLLTIAIVIVLSLLNIPS